MPAWKTFLICASGCVCMSLAVATILVTLSHEGSDRWLWLAVLLTATVCAVALFTLFLRHASAGMIVKTRGRIT